MEPPSRREIDAAATALVARHGAQMLATARRDAAAPEDAEDAYQRGLEILVRKAPTTREYELVPCWNTIARESGDHVGCESQLPPSTALARSAPR